MELGLSLAIGDRVPLLRANHRLQEDVVAATVEAAKGFKPLRDQYLDLQVGFLIVQLPL